MRRRKDLRARPRRGLQDRTVPDCHRATRYCRVEGLQIEREGGIVSEPWDVIMSSCPFSTRPCHRCPLLDDVQQVAAGTAARHGIEHVIRLEAPQKVTEECAAAVTGIVATPGVPSHIEMIEARQARRGAGVDRDLTQPGIACLCRSAPFGGLACGVKWVHGKAPNHNVAHMPCPSLLLSDQGESSSATCPRPSLLRPSSTR